MRRKSKPVKEKDLSALARKSWIYILVQNLDRKKDISIYDGRVELFSNRDCSINKLYIAEYLYRHAWAYIKTSENV